MKKSFFTKSGKAINVYDNMFPYSYREDMYAFCKSAKYNIGWSDNIHMGRAETYLHSQLSDDDILQSGTPQAIEGCEVFDEFKGYDLVKSVVNLSTPADSHFAHVHTDVDKVYLYYANLEWLHGWHGETLFYNDDFTEIELALPYTAGRCVVFDGSIPHTIRPQSHSSDKHRFTMTIMLRKSKSE